MVTVTPRVAQNVTITSLVWCLQDSTYQRACNTKQMSLNGVKKFLLLLLFCFLVFVCFCLFWEVFFFVCLFVCLFFVVVFFCVPQLCLWGSPLFGEIFAYVTVI